MSQRKRVILDTDIGDDIDDTWALGFLLNCPELELLYVLTEYGPTTRRAKIACKFLDQVGRTDVEVGIGKETEVLKERMYHEGWASDYDLDAYPGTLSRKGIKRLIELIMESEEEVVIICIGPLVNIAEAARRQPKIIEKTRIVGMLGSIRSGWFPDTPPVSEYNVICSTKSARNVLQLWHDKGRTTLTPLDTCGRVHLGGSLYAHWKQQAQTGQSKVSLAIWQNFAEWTKKRSPTPNKQGEVILEEASSTLFDTVAVYLAFASEFLKMEELNLAIKNDGKMVEIVEASAETSAVLCAMEWIDMPGFQQFLVDRLLKVAFVSPTFWFHIAFNRTLQQFLGGGDE